MSNQDYTPLDFIRAKYAQAQKMGQIQEWGNVKEQERGLCAGTGTGTIPDRISRTGSRTPAAPCGRFSFSSSLARDHSARNVLLDEQEPDWREEND